MAGSNRRELGDGACRAGCGLSEENRGWAPPEAETRGRSKQLGDAARPTGFHSETAFDATGRVSGASIISRVLRPYRSVHPRVAETAFIDQSAQVIGDVVIDDDSSVWMNAVLRGDINSIRVGQRTNIQDGCVVHVMGGTHPTTLGNEVTVGHAAVLHGCAIADRCLIGMGAIVLNGAEIGSDSIVAAGTLVVERLVVPPRSLVMGSPGRVRWTLTDDEVASIRRYAESYVGHKDEYTAS